MIRPQRMIVTAIFACLLGTVGACSSNKASSGKKDGKKKDGKADTTAVASASSPDYGRPQVVGKIELADIKESSGLSASECQDVLWTHNDAGNNPLIYAMNLQGKH